jgi:hypothetical protein
MIEPGTMGGIYKSTRIFCSLLPGHNRIVDWIQKAESGPRLIYTKFCCNQLVTRSAPIGGYFCSLWGIGVFFPLGVSVEAAVGTRFIDMHFGRKKAPNYEP